MERLPRTTSLSLWRGTPMALASWLTLMPKGSSHSSSNTRPGCIGGLTRSSAAISSVRLSLSIICFLILLLFSLNSIVVLGYLHTVGVARLIIELKADAPLHVDADRPLPLTVARELVQPIGGGLRKLREASSLVQYRQLRFRPFKDLRRDLPGAPAHEDPRRILVPEAPYHGLV